MKTIELNVSDLYTEGALVEIIIMRFELANKKAETFKVPAKNYYKCRLTNSIILPAKTMYQ